MSKFKLERYVDGGVDVDDTTNATEPKKQGREVTIKGLDSSPISKIVAEALYTELSRDKIDMVSMDENSEGVLKDIRVIGLEDLNASLRNATMFAQEADVIILDGKINGDSVEQDMFLNNIDGKEIYLDYESFARRGVPKLFSEVIDETTVSNEDHDGDDVIEYKGCMYKIVTIDDGVLVGKLVVTDITTNDEDKDDNPATDGEGDPEGDEHED